MLRQLFPHKAAGESAPPPVFSTQLSDGNIRLSDSASDKFRQLANSIDENFSGIRLFVMGGGCGGMTYSMTYADQTSPFDTILESEGFTLVVDAVALNYLQGCTIDYVKQGLNETFVFRDVFQSIGGSGGCSGCAAAGGGGY